MATLGVDVRAPHPSCPSAQTEEALAIMPLYMREEARDLQNRWDERPPYPMYLGRMWDRWNEEDRLVDGRKGSHILSILMENDEAVITLNDKISAHYLACSEEEINSVTSEGPLTLKGSLGPYISETSLTWIKYSVLLSLKDKRHRGFYRVLDHIGSGMNAQVFSLGLRTPSRDRETLALLQKAGDSLGTKHRDELRVMRASQTPIVAVKEAIGSPSSPACGCLIREYAIMREVSALLLPLGIRACPVPYAVKSWETYEGPTYTTTHVGDNKDHYIRAAMIESGSPSLGGPKVSLFMQYIEGRTLRDSSLSTEELNVVLLYLHGVLNILWTKKKIVHGDIHGGNIMLEGYGLDRNYTLPICNGEGDVLYNVTLPFRPILLDWGMASSETVNGYAIAASPLKSPLCDIIAMYSRLTVGEYKTVGFIHCKKLCNNYIKEFWKEICPPILSPPYGLTIPDLDHSELSQSYIEMDVHEVFITNEIQEVSEDVHLSVPLEEEEEYRSLVREAESLLSSYYSGSTARQEDDPRSNTRFYLREVIAFYSSLSH